MNHIQLQLTLEILPTYTGWIPHPFVAHHTWQSPYKAAPAAVQTEHLPSPPVHSHPW